MLNEQNPKDSVCSQKIVKELDEFLAQAESALLNSKADDYPEYRARFASVFALRKARDAAREIHARHFNI